MNNPTVPSPDNSRLIKSSVYLLLAKIMYGDIEDVKNLLRTHESLLNTPDEETCQLFAEFLDTPAEELTVQYENLFYIPGRYYAAPYMTVYSAESEGRPVQRADHTAWYRQAGMDSWAASREERSDHIGHFLMLLHKDFLGEENTSTSDEVVKYLYQVLGLFERQVSEMITKGFYLNVVRFLHQCIDEEKRERNLL